MFAVGCRADEYSNTHGLLKPLNPSQVVQRRLESEALRTWSGQPSSAAGEFRASPPVPAPARGGMTPTGWREGRAAACTVPWLRALLGSLLFCHVVGSVPKKLEAHAHGLKVSLSVSLS
jgi:hypothetical protein